MLPPASRRPCFSYLALENFSSFHFFPLPWSWRYTPSTLLPVVDNDNDLVKVSKLFRITFTLFAVCYHLCNVKNVKNTHGVSTLWIPQMVPNWKTLVNVRWVTCNFQVYLKIFPRNLMKQTLFVKIITHLQPPFLPIKDSVEDVFSWILQSFLQKFFYNRESCF